MRAVRFLRDSWFHVRSPGGDVLSICRAARLTNPKVLPFLQGVEDGIRWKSSHGLIENLRWDRPLTALSGKTGLEITPISSFYEGPFEISNVTIRGNTFTGLQPSQASELITVCKGSHTITTIQAAAISDKRATSIGPEISVNGVSVQPCRCRHSLSWSICPFLHASEMGGHVCCQSRTLPAGIAAESRSTSMHPALTSKRWAATCRGAALSCEVYAIRSAFDPCKLIYTAQPELPTPFSELESMVAALGVTRTLPS